MLLLKIGQKKEINKNKKKCKQNICKHTMLRATYIIYVKFYRF